MILNCSVVLCAHLLTVLFKCQSLAPLLRCLSDSVAVSVLSSAGWLSHCPSPVFFFFCPLSVFSSHLAGFLLRQHCSQMINNLENGSESGDGLIPVEKEQLGGQMPWKGNNHWKPFTQIWADFLPNRSNCLDIQKLLSHFCTFLYSTSASKSYHYFMIKTYQFRVLCFDLSFEPKYPGFDLGFFINQLLYFTKTISSLQTSVSSFVKWKCQSL